MLDVPRAFRVWLRLAPTELHERLFAVSINHLLRGQTIGSRLRELEGKRFRLCAEDVPIELTFELAEGALRRSALSPDVTFRASLADFIALAKRRADPDTLFFHRRLSVEGRTEAGLHLKNLLDAWEYDVPAHVRAVLPAPLAHAFLGLSGAARALHGLSQVRRPSSRRNSPQAESSRAS